MPILDGSSRRRARRLVEKQILTKKTSEAEDPGLLADKAVKNREDALPDEGTEALALQRHRAVLAKEPVDFAELEPAQRKEASEAGPDGVRVSPTHPLFARAWPRNMWHPSARWETSRIAAIGPRAARYGRSRPLLTLAPFTALRTRARVKKEYLPTHPWASGKTPARALRKWRATGVNQFGHTANAVWRPSRKGLASRLAALARGARITQNDILQDRLSPGPTLETRGQYNKTRAALTTPTTAPRPRSHSPRARPANQVVKSPPRPA